MNARLLRAVVVVAVMASGVSARPQPFPSPAEGTCSSFPPGGGHYDCTIPRKLLDSSPDWADTEPNPPLPARKAMSLAQATLNATLKEPIDPSLKRSLAAVTLLQLRGKKWCWEVRYEWHTRVGGETGVPGDFRVFILMNGTVAPIVRIDDK
jgi:hypothetical protein